VTSVRHSFWQVSAAALLLVAILALASTFVHRSRLTGYTERERLLRSEMDSVKVYLDRLAELLEEKPGLSSLDVERMKDRGLKDPVDDIKASLREKRELIPYEGVMGGTMDFYEIHVLTPRWVLAYFEDGHVGGYMLLEYDVSEDGKVSWELIRAHMQ
jgi:hypothetical protein